MSTQSLKPWYKRPWGILLILCLWPCFAVWYVWKKTGYGRPAKWGLTALVGILFIGGLSALGAINPAAPAPSPSPIAAQVPGIATPAVITKTDTPDATAVPTPTPTLALFAAFPAPSKTAGCHSSNGLPDAACTPGAANPAVTQATIKSTICVSGYTATIRPSTSYTNNLKAQQIKAYGYADTDLSDYEEDHLVSLELGGSPTSPANLWPEPHAGASTSTEKDKVENYLHSEVCSGGISLAAAQQEIAADWTAVYAARYSSLSGASASDLDDSVPAPTPTPAVTSTPAPTSTPSTVDPGSPPVKMSTNNICHAQGDEYYDRTTNFTPYQSMADCVAAGGRPSN